MQHEVNLLPWREALRAKYKRRFMSMLVLGVLIAVGIQWGFGQYLSDQKSQQQERLNQLQAHISYLDEQIRKLKSVEMEHESIITRLKTVESLQNERNKTTEFMNVMPSLIPEGVYVDKMKMRGHELEISGISDSTARLASMLDNFENEELLNDVEMHSIVSGKELFGKNFQTFKVSFNFLTSAQKAKQEKANEEQGGKRG